MSKPSKKQREAAAKAAAEQALNAELTRGLREPAEASSNSAQGSEITRQPAEEPVSLHDLAVVVMRAADAASHSQKQAKGDKEGAGVVALRMYQTGATEAELREAFSAVEAEARSGLIEGVKLEVAKRKGKDGGVQYLIPGAFMNAKSITCKAAVMKLPRNYPTYTDLRNAVKEESDRLKLAEASEQEKAYAELVAQATRLVDSVKEKETAALPTTILLDMAEQIEALVTSFGHTACSLAAALATVSAEAAEAAEELAQAA